MLSFFPRGVLGEILNLIESVSEGFPSYFFVANYMYMPAVIMLDKREIKYTMNTVDNMKSNCRYCTGRHFRKRATAIFI